MFIILIMFITLIIIIIIIISIVIVIVIFIVIVIIMLLLLLIIIITIIPSHHVHVTTSSSIYVGVKIIMDSQKFIWTTNDTTNYQPGSANGIEWLIVFSLPVASFPATASEFRFFFFKKIDWFESSKLGQPWNPIVYNHFPPWTCYSIISYNFYFVKQLYLGGIWTVIMPHHRWWIIRVSMNISMNWG